MDRCTAIALVETKPVIGDLLQVEFNHDMKAYWFYPYNDALQFLNKDVIVEFRKDVYKGEMCDFINTFTVNAVVTVLDKEQDFKLFCNEEDNNANVYFDDIEDGTSRQGAIVFCTSQSFESSSKAAWMELVVRDKKMKTAILRIFDYESKDVELEGHYVVTSLSRNKYGFTSDLVKALPQDAYANPELALGRKYVENFFADKDDAREFIQRAGIYNALENDIDYEKGYGFVRLAMELAMVDSMKNITNDIDLHAISCALLASRASVMRSSSFSPMVTNILIAKQFRWRNQRLVMQLLDDALTEQPKEREVMRNIQNTVAALLAIRKGVK